MSACRRHPPQASITLTIDVSTNSSTAASVTAIAMRYRCLYGSSATVVAFDDTADGNSDTMAVTRYEPAGAADAVAVPALPSTRTLATTDIPGRSGRSAPSVFVMRMRTGMRCTTFVKFPVALSGGNNENLAPVAEAMLVISPSAAAP